MNSVIIDRIDIVEKKISVYYTPRGEWEKLFGPENSFWVEYDFDVSEIPQSIAVVPIMGTLLTLSWLYDGEIILDELDKDFYDSIPDIKNGYKTMYPDVDFKGSITVNKIVENRQNGNQSACLFSGGVDAFSTLISHLDEKPTLLTVWGADIDYDNNDGWGVVKNHIKSIADQFKLKYETVHTNFRKIINEVMLDSELPQRTGDMWWHGFQSGTGLLTLMAPYAFYNGIDCLYIASTYTKEFWGQYKCSSDPVIDNFIRYNGTRVYHDGYEFPRQDKIHRICEYSRENNIKIPLRVCWKSPLGTNCCACEKCYRTILGIYAERENPNKYGFDYRGGDFEVFMQELKCMYIEREYYVGIQKAMKENYTYKSVNSCLKWFYKAKFNNTSGLYIHTDPNEVKKIVYIYSKLPEFMKKIYRVIRKLKKTIN